MRKTIYIMPAKEKEKLDIDSFLSKVYAYAVRVCISLAVTGLVAWYLIALAYAERGYNAVGGEYIAIPSVFFGIYKLTGLIMKFISAKVVRMWKKEK